MWNYLKFSNIQVAINLNPFSWGFHLEYGGPTTMDPAMYFLVIKVIMIRVSIVLDDGSW
jgi:hypothetical protein